MKEDTDARHPEKAYEDEKRMTSSSYTSIFSTHDKQVEGTLDDGSTIFTLFGSFRLDSVSAAVTDNTIIDVTCFFGNVSIELPHDVNVDVKGTPVFGELKNKRSGKNGEMGLATVTVRVLCLFGEVTIR
ncbi:MAG: LiaF-related protein [Sphaerochaetaceae bacterium]|nr:LiaF-related protein [Sphaerochaetaceae bacterium]